MNVEIRAENASSMWPCTSKYEKAKSFFAIAVGVLTRRVAARNALGMFPNGVAREASICENKAGLSLVW